jgi:phospholipid/cholesterol/gamma-HCH transport system substrate-binding protein
MGVKWLKTKINSMKNQGKNNVKLGMFVSICLAIFIAAIYYIGREQQMFNTTFRISAVFRDVNGLQAGNNVRFSGINVGTIEGIEMLSDTAVRVDMILDESCRKFMKKDAVVLIGSDGLMGNKIAIISPGSGDTVEDGDMLATTQPISFEEIIAELQTTTQNASQITNDLTQITGSIRSGRGVVGRLFMDSVMADNLSMSISNIRDGAGGFKENMDAASQSFWLRRNFRKKNNKKDEVKQEKKEHPQPEGTKDKKLWDKFKKKK